MDEPRTHHLEVEKLIMETILGDTAPDEKPQAEAPTESTGTQEEKEEESSGPRVYTNEFAIGKLFFHGQKREQPLENIVIRSTSTEDFIDQIFTLVKPYLKRGVYFPEPDRPCWFENEVPTKEDLFSFIQFKDTIQKRSWRLDSVDQHMLIRWEKRVVYLQVYVHTNNISSRALWDLVQQELFGIQPESRKAAIPKELQDAQRLQFVIRKLQKLHQDYLVPRTDDAFTLWARLILQQPTRKKRDLLYDRPPKQLLENFVVIGRETKKRSCTISGPAQRGHTKDGFGFQDEILALRNTVSQIKDLVEMLDRRVEMLEDKSRGFQQTLEGVPIKKRKRDTTEDSGDEKEDDGQEMGEENDEPPIDVVSPLVNVVGNCGNPDPLVFEDMIVKEETEIESDG